MGCGGHWTDTPNGRDFDCENGYIWGCDQCPCCIIMQEKRRKKEMKCSHIGKRNKENAIRFGRLKADSLWKDFMVEPNASENRGDNFNEKVTPYNAFRKLAEVELFLTKRSGKASQEEKELAGNEFVKRWDELVYNKKV